MNMHPSNEHSAMMVLAQSLQRRFFALGQHHYGHVLTARRNVHGMGPQNCLPQLGRGGYAHGAGRQAHVGRCGVLGRSTRAAALGWGRTSAPTQPRLPELAG